MTKERFRDILKRLHPDKHGGRRVHGYTGLLNALRQWNIQRRRRFNHCWCGVAIHLSSKTCKMHERRRAIGLLTAGLLLFLCGCESPKTTKPVNPIASAPRRSLIMAAAAVVPASPVLTLQVATEPATYGIDHLGNVLTNNPVYQHGYWRIDYSPDLAAWTFYTNATDAVFAVPLISQQGFWRVRRWEWVSP
jgi:hypothetical protein